MMSGEAAVNFEAVWHSMVDIVTNMQEFELDTGLQAKGIKDLAYQFIFR